MHTHQIAIDGDVVRKRFVSWADGEADREWNGLVALATAVPRLAPEPVAREVEDGAPVVVMSRLPGSALGGSGLSVAQVDAIGSSLRRLSDAPVDAAPQNVRSDRPRCVASSGRGPMVVTT